MNISGSFFHKFDVGATNPAPDAQPGQGTKVAKAFQQAGFETDGYEGSRQVSQLGLEQVVGNQRATPRERLVAHVVLNQAEQAEKAFTAHGDSSGSRSMLVTEGLAYLAAGGATTGPIGAVLADLGCRQMDSIRGQKFNTSSASDVRDSNVAGKTMLAGIAEFGDPSSQEIASQTLKDLGKKYGPKDAGKSLPLTEVLLQDAKAIYGALDNIKTVTAQGDPTNPKCMAFLEGELPKESGHMSIGRPGGGWVDYPSAGQGFGVTHGPEERSWDR